MAENKSRGVPLSPKSMVDSVADWSIRQVVEHLKKREADSRPVAEESRIWCRSGIRMLGTVVRDAASSFGISRGKMCRYLTYHGVAILENDSVMADLLRQRDVFDKAAMSKDDPDISDIATGRTGYSPQHVDTDRFDFYVYDGNVLARIGEMAQLCSVYPGQVGQVAMVCSLLTYASPDFEPVRKRFEVERMRWNRWMKFRLDYLGLAVPIFETAKEKYGE